MKVAALANAHALAHVSRLLEISKVLRSHGHEITFAGRGKYLQIASQDGFTTRELPYISAEQIVRAVRTQATVSSEETRSKASTAAIRTAGLCG